MTGALLKTGMLQTGGVLVTEIPVMGAVLAIQLLTGALLVTGALVSTGMLTVGTQQKTWAGVLLEMEVCLPSQGRHRQPSHGREGEDPPLRLLKIQL